MVHQVYCAICGAPVLTGSNIKWLEEATMLTSAHETENGIELDTYLPHRLCNSSLDYYLDLTSTHSNNQRVLRLNAQTKDGSARFALDSGEEVLAYHVDSTLFQSPGPPRGGSPLYIPVHKQCMQIADRYIAWKSSRQDHAEQRSNCIDSIQSLWKMLYLRIDADPIQINPLCREPHEFYGGRACRGKDWDPDGSAKHGIMMQEDPIEIPSLTESILRNLSPYPVTLGTMIPDLEIQNSHTETHHHLQTTKLQSEDSRNPDERHSTLITSTSFPWLWDLNPHLIHTKQQEGNWNWRVLIHLLSQTDLHEPDDKTLQLPLSLRNRRRIWRILEEARVGDIKEEKIKRAAEQEGKREVGKSGLDKGGRDAKSRLVAWLDGPPGFCFKLEDDRALE